MDLRAIRKEQKAANSIINVCHVCHVTAKKQTWCFRSSSPTSNVEAAQNEVCDFHVLLNLVSFTKLWNLKSNTFDTGSETQKTQTKWHVTVSIATTRTHGRKIKTRRAVSFFNKDRASNSIQLWVKKVQNITRREVTMVLRNCNRQKTRLLMGRQTRNLIWGTHSMTDVVLLPSCVLGGLHETTYNTCSNSWRSSSLICADWCSQIVTPVNCDVDSGVLSVSRNWCVTVNQ